MTVTDKRVEAAIIAYAIAQAKGGPGAMRAALLAADAAAWEPMDTAPRDGTEIVLCRAISADGTPITGSSFGVFCQVAAWWGEEEWIVYCSQVQEPRLHFEPTHWRPLPTAPKGNK